jgi:hypothetical protein
MGAAVSIGITGRTDAATVSTLAALVERLGFHALWINDIPGGDSLAGLRVAAEATATLGLATGVIPLDRRPVGTLDLAGVPADRTVLGIGSGGARHPLGLVRDGIAALRRATDAAIVVGGLGPRMRRLAAEQADGGDRTARSILYVRTIAEDAARPALEAEARRYETVPSYAANFERAGIRAIDATIDDPAGLAAFDVVDEIVLRAITPTGSLAELQRFAETTARWRHDPA